MKIYTNEFDHMTNMAAMPIYGKNLKKIFFCRTNRPMTLKLGISMSMQVLPRLFKLWTLVDLDPFYAKIKFGEK